MLLANSEPFTNGRVIVAGGRVRRGKQKRADYHEDLSGRIGSIRAPTLLLWGDADPISPVAVGTYLQKLLPRSSLHVLHGGKHDLVIKLAPDVARLIDEHLKNSA